MRARTPFRRKRLVAGDAPATPVIDVRVERELQCSRCKAIFPDYLARCPECGSDEWIGLGRSAARGARPLWSERFSAQEACTLPCRANVTGPARPRRAWGVYPCGRQSLPREVPHVFLPID